MWSTIEEIAESIKQRHLVEPAIFLLELSKPLVGCMRELYGMSEPLQRVLVGQQNDSAIRELLSSSERIEDLIVLLEERRDASPHDRKL